MLSRSDQSTVVGFPAAKRRGRSQRHSNAERESALARSALAFAVRAHAGQPHDRHGTQFIEHPLEVARLLRDAGCSGVLVAAGLLHGIVENTPVTEAELTWRFGADVADLVQIVSDNASVEGYRQRKQIQRDRIAAAGTNAALLCAADTISEVRALPSRTARDRGRCEAAAPHSRARARVERYHKLRIDHYRHSLEMLKRVAPRHPLVTRLARELDHCDSAMAR